MSRENFIVKLTGVLDNNPEYIMISNIAHLSETKEGTEIHLVGGGSVVVAEKVDDIERKGAAFSVLKVIK
jgi:hypothetical protein